MFSCANCLEQEFVADSPGRIAGAFFLAPQDCERDAGLGQQLRQRPHDLLIALDQRAAAADPQQDFGVAGIGHRRRSAGPGPNRRAKRPCRETDGRASRPTSALAASCRETRRLPSPDSDACRRSSASARSTPDKPRRRRRRSCTPTSLRPTGPASRRCTIARNRAFSACDKPLQIENDVARRKHLAHAIGRAGRGAAAALGAGVEIEQVLPAEAGQGVDAQLFFGFSKSILRRFAPIGASRAV